MNSESDAGSGAERPSTDEGETPVLDKGKAGTGHSSPSEWDAVRKQAAHDQVRRPDVAVSEDGWPSKAVQPTGRSGPPWIAKDVSHTDPMFVPISIDDYVRKHLAANPGVDREDLIDRLRSVLESVRAGARCACGEAIWVIGSAEVGMSCFTCITGEATPSGDFEIAEVIDG